MAAPQENERVVLAFSTHWIKYAMPTFIYVILMPISIALFVAAGMAAQTNAKGSFLIFLGALALMLLVHHWFFHRLLSEAMVDVIITTRRVIFLRDSLLFHDDMREISLEKIPAVEAQKHGLVENILRYGTLRFDTGGSESEDAGVMIPLVPHPHKVAKEITMLLKMI